MASMLTLALGALQLLHAASARVMAVLPAGAVPGITAPLTVTEDLATPGAPIIFSSAAGAELYRVTKNEAVPRTSNASFGASLTPPVELPRVLAEGADLLWNDELVTLGAVSATGVTAEVMYSKGGVRIKTDDGAAPKPHVVIAIGGKRRGSLVSLVLSNTRRIRI